MYSNILGQIQATFVNIKFVNTIYINDLSQVGHVHFLFYMYFLMNASVPEKMSLLRVTVKL